MTCDTRFEKMVTGDIEQFLKSTWDRDIIKQHWHATWPFFKINMRHGDPLIGRLFDPSKLSSLQSLVYGVTQTGDGGDEFRLFVFADGEPDAVSVVTAGRAPATNKGGNGVLLVLTMK